MVLDWSNLLLLPSGESDDAAVATAKVAAPTVGVVEPCGRSFHARQYVVAAAAKEEAATEGNADDAAMKDALRTKLDRKNLDLEDYYALMGLDEFGWKSTVEQVKEQWKHISFLCHPDKSSPEGRPYGEKRFKAMQLAYATLTDKQKRIGYDSQLPFDEKLPKAKEGLTEDKFYAAYGPVFDRNSRFSENKPVPELGDKDSSDEHVIAFYQFWFAFKSWRDFTYLDEHKNDDGTDRFTRRENDRKNKKLRAAKKKEEMARVRKLVEDAEKKDPRVKRQREAEKEAAARRKQEKRDRAAARNNQGANSKAAQEKAAQEAKAAEKAAAEAAKKATAKAGSSKKAAEKKVKRLCKGGRAGAYAPEDVLKVTKGSSVEQLEALIAVMNLHVDGPNPPPLSDAEKQACQDLFAETLKAV